MLVEIRIVKKSSEDGTRKWIMAIPAVELKGQAGDHVEVWTTRDPATKKDLVTFRFVDKTVARTGGNARLYKLTPDKTSPWVICNPRFMDGDSYDEKVVPDYLGSKMTRSTTSTLIGRVGRRSIYRYTFEFPTWSKTALAREVDAAVGAVTGNSVPGRRAKITLAPAAKVAVVAANHRDAIDARDNLNAALADDPDLIVCVKDSDGKIVGEGRSVSLRVVEVLTTTSTREL